MSRRSTRTAVAALVVVTAVGVALLVGRALLDQAPEPEQPSRPETAARAADVEPWLNTACAAVVAGRDGPTSVVGAVSATGDPSTSAGRRDLLEALDRALGEAEERLARADEEVAAAGVPEVEGGDGVSAQLRAGLSQAQGRLSAASQALAAVPSDPQARFEQGVVAALGGLEEPSEGLRAAVDAIRDHPDLGPRLGEVDACEGLA